MIRRIVPWVLMCVIVAWAISAAIGTRLVKQSIEDLVIHSTLVVTGTVKEIHSRWNDEHNQIHTFITIEIDSVSKGKTEEKAITLTQLGGIVGDTAMTVIGNPRFTENEQVLLFLKPQPGTTDEIMVTGLAQGKFHLETDPATGEVHAENEFEGRFPLSLINDRVRNLFGR